MKKGDIIPVQFDKLIRLNTVASYPIEKESDKLNKDIVTRENKIKVKNVIPGKEGIVRITKKRGKTIIGQLINYTDLEIPSEHICKNPLRCGGCTYNVISSQEELELKNNYLKELFEGYPYEGLIEVNNNRQYRNKMEYSFGNETKDGELILGLHEKGRFYNVIDTDECLLVPEDFEIIRKAIQTYFRDRDKDFYHKNSHVGFLRFLVLRRGEKTGNILVNLVTSTQDTLDENDFVSYLNNLELKGQITGILWTFSDNIGDAVNPESEKVLAGSPIFEDKILDKSFLITPYSFFQVNTSGADQLFTIVREYLSNVINQKEGTVLFDLYSGTGTIGLLVDDLVDEIDAIEINDEAVNIARENAKLNNSKNINFISGDVLEKVDELNKQADIIILDPPRSGIHRKSLKKILEFNPKHFIYISCNPVELRKDLPEFEAKGYQVKRMKSVNLFPMTTNVETVCLLSKDSTI